MSFPKVDVHSHFLPDFYREALREAGHVPGPDGTNVIPDWSPEAHLEFMREHKIRKAYLSISSPGTFLCPPPSSPKNASKAISLTRRVNDYASDLKRRHPDRFGYFASLPLPDVDASLQEIRRCYSALDPRPDGFCLLSNAYGLYLGDPRMAPVYEALNGRSAVIFVHPTAACTSRHAHDPSANPAGPPQRLAANMPMMDIYMVPMLEFLFDTTRTFSDILITGTAPKYPNIRWIVPHCGSTLPSVLDRVIRFTSIMGTTGSSSSSSSFDPHARGTTGLTTASVKALFSKHFYFDMAGMSMPSQVHHMLRWVDHTRLLYGSDVPFTPWKAASALEAEFVDGLLDLFGGNADTDAPETRDICGKNAQRLFGEPDVQGEQDTVSGPEDMKGRLQDPSTRTDGEAS